LSILLSRPSKMQRDKGIVPGIWMLSITDYILKRNEVKAASKEHRVQDIRRLEVRKLGVFSISLEP